MWRLIAVTHMIRQTDRLVRMQDAAHIAQMALQQPTKTNRQRHHNCHLKTCVWRLHFGVVCFRIVCVAFAGGDFHLVRGLHLRVEREWEKNNKSR